MRKIIRLCCIIMALALTAALVSCSPAGPAQSGVPGGQTESGAPDLAESAEPSADSGKLPDQDAATALLWETLSDKIEEMNANVAPGNSIAIVASGTETVQGESCWSFALGTNSEEKFTAEEYYAVSETGVVYYMNIIAGGVYERYAP